MMEMNVLLIGNGAREHSIAWKLSRSPHVRTLYVAPGNGGTAQLGSKVKNVPIGTGAFEQLVIFAQENHVNLVVPGPEQPLCDGIKDYFEERIPKIQVFGPSKAASKLEGSKSYAKAFMSRYGIPTAASQTFTDLDEARKFLLANQRTRWVLKADGLAAGKGVIIPSSHEEAIQGLETILVHQEFGKQVSVVIEEFMEGEEISILSFSDGYTFRNLPAAQDHKRHLDGDQGLNTGGMGAYAPASIASREILDRIDLEILQPTLDGMRQERSPFVGCLFTGLMLTASGPRVVEYNCRFGDPECQTLLPLLECDLLEVFLACTGNYLSSVDLKISFGFSTTVVASSAGYPESYTKGTLITTAEPSNAEASFHFHAGTAIDAAGQLRTNGGRVISSTATASTLESSVVKAYESISLISFDGMHFRKDIAHRELQRPKKVDKLSYATAGVSIDNGNTLVQRIKGHLRKTRRPGCDGEIGGFGGAVSLPAAGYGADSPTIIAAIDGIGTKLMIAKEMKNYSTIGIDLVAMNTNDLLVQGAEPLAFLDYYACSKLDVDVTTSFVEGVAEGCVQSLATLIGGETAEMPGLYQHGDFDAAGCAIGAIARGKTILPDLDRMRAGDVLVGLASSGAHSNGYSLIRKIVERSGLEYMDQAPWDTSRKLGDVLLEPTHIYVKPILKILRSHEGAIKGMAHITGGGLVENIPRALPNSLTAIVDIGSWAVPPVLKWLKQVGELEHKEFARTFNTGLGMVLIVEASKEGAVREQLQAEGEEVFTIGKLVERQADEGCVLANIETWDSLGWRKVT